MNMNGLNQWKDLYESNKNFRDYVDRYMSNRDVTLEEVLSFKQTQLVGEMYRKKDENDGKAGGQNA
jgi:hypothetical protein